MVVTFALRHTTQNNIIIFHALLLKLRQKAFMQNYSNLLFQNLKYLTQHVSLYTCHIHDDFTFFPEPFTYKSQICEMIL